MACCPTTPPACPTPPAGFGGLVAYHGDIKRDLLGIGDAPVVSKVVARAMAGKVAQLLGADCSLAATAVGGPGRDDGLAPGTV